MILEGSFIIPAPPERVWDAIWDVPTLASWVSGCTLAERLPGDEERYRVRIEQKIGLVRATFDLLMEVLESEAPRRILLKGWGEDSRLASRVSLTTAVTLEPAEPAATLLRYRHDISVFGKLGALGYPIIQRKAREVEAEFAQRAIATLTRS